MFVAVCIAIVLLAVPSAFFVLEVVAALPRDARRPAVVATPCRVGVVIPAHDEAAGIAATLATLAPQLGPRDRLLVVADNCGDDTAGRAREAGAEVLERRDAERRGKGFALAAGLEALAGDPPEVVLFVDADCRVAPGSVDALRAAGRLGPAQATYLMRAPDGAPPSRRLAELLFLVRNQVRPRGLERIGAPCLFTGAGMAMPWAVARAAPIGSASVVEDVQLAIDLAVAGTPPRYCPEALVESEFPVAEAAAGAQRSRWLWGTLRTAAQGPRLVAAALRRGRPGLIALALDLVVPPLSLLLPAWALVGAAAAWLGWRTGEWRPLAAAVVWLGATGGAVVAAWARFARARVPARVVLAAPFYALPTIGSALAALLRRRQRWNRTKRD